MEGSTVNSIPTPFLSTAFAHVWSSFFFLFLTTCSHLLASFKPFMPNFDVPS